MISFFDKQEAFKKIFFILTIYASKSEKEKIIIKSSFFLLKVLSRIIILSILSILSIFVNAKNKRLIIM
jgi:hypothetical protein